MATRLGKLFVLCVFAFSLFCLACSIGVYSVRTKWMMPPDEKNKLKSAASPEARHEILYSSGGIVDRLQDRIEDLAFARDRVEYRYTQNSQLMFAAEQNRGQRQFYYKAKLDLLKTGKDEKGQLVAAPVQALDYDPATKQVITTTLLGRNPIVSHGAPLLSFDAYQSSAAVVDKNINDTLAAIKQSQEKLAALTEDVQGLAGDVQRPGLRKLIELQEDAKLRAMDEQEYLKPFLANRYGEAVLLLKRQQALLQRKQELDKLSPVTSDR
jgi:hypothetical protein